MENCFEIFLNEVTHIELVQASVCTLPIPFCVGEITQMNNCTIGEATMVVDISSTSADGLLQSAPTLNTQEKPQAAGYLRNHDLQIPIKDGYDTIRQKRGSLAGRDFYVVLRMLSGSEFLLYSLPNTSTVSVEDQVGSESKQTVKVSLQSLSNMIKITRTNN